MTTCVPRMGAWRLHVAVVFSAVVVVACQQEGGRSGDPQHGFSDPPPYSHPMDEPGKTAYAHLQDYMAVVRDPQRFDECLTSDPGRQPHLCLSGARTGSRSGEAVHAWMLGQLQQIEGVQYVQQQSFDWPRFAPAHYALSVEDGQGGVFAPATYPWHFQGVTGAQGVRGRLVNLVDGSLLQRALAGSLDGKIAILGSLRHIHASEENAEQKLAALQRAGAVGAVYALPGPDNDIIAQNYDAALGMQALPTLIVGRQDREQLMAMEGQQATLIVDGSVQASRSYNTYAFIPGRDNSRMIVIGTPMNAWFQAASERGPGVGALIYLARYFAEQARRFGPPPVTLAFVATGAHETMGFGLERALRCLDAQRVTAYVHLGTGLASRGYHEDNGVAVDTGEPSMRRWIVVSENRYLKNLAIEAFERLMSNQGIGTVRAGIFNGSESQAPYAMHIPVVGMTGGGWFHHSPRDDETRLSVEYLDDAVLGFRNTIEALLEADTGALALGNLTADVIAALQKLPGYACPAPIDLP